MWRAAGKRVTRPVLEGRGVRPGLDDPVVDRDVDLLGGDARLRGGGEA